MFYIFLFILGVCIGSFLNVLIDRLPQNEKITGRSHCDYCKNNLKARDLIPIISFFWQKGRCRYCKKKLSWQYPIIEIFTGIIFILVFWIQFSAVWIQNVGYDFQFLIINNHFYFLSFIFALIIVSCLIVIFFADVKYQIIPDQMLIILFICLLIINYLNLTLLNNFIAGIILFLIFLGLYLITKGKGIGFGDVKLAFIIGWMLGFKLGISTLYMAFIIGGIYSLILILSGKAKLKSKIAFGPFIIIGMILTLFFKSTIIEFINNMIISY